MPPELHRELKFCMANIGQNGENGSSLFTGRQPGESVARWTLSWPGPPDAVSVQGCLRLESEKKNVYITD